MKRFNPYETYETSTRSLYGTFRLLIQIFRAKPVSCNATTYTRFIQLFLSILSVSCAPNELFYSPIPLCSLFWQIAELLLSGQAAYKNFFRTTDLRGIFRNKEAIFELQMLDKLYTSPPCFLTFMFRCALTLKCNLQRPNILRLPFVSLLCIFDQNSDTTKQAASSIYDLNSRNQNTWQAQMISPNVMAFIYLLWCFS